MVTHADGYAERDAALLMLAEKQEGRSRRITVGADKAYDTKDFVSTVRELNVTPHVTKNDKGRTSNLDRRTTRQPGYAISLSRRWLIEKGFGWLKQSGPLRQVKLRGLKKVDLRFVFSCAAVIAFGRLFSGERNERYRRVEDTHIGRNRHHHPADQLRHLALPEDMEAAAHCRRRRMLVHGWRGQALPRFQFTVDVR